LWVDGKCVGLYKGDWSEETGDDTKESWVVLKSDVFVTGEKGKVVLELK